MNYKQISIDGPAGAGKSSVAKILAEKLKYLYIDTGAMYRALALKALRSNIDLQDDNEMLELAHGTVITFQYDRMKNNQRVYCDSEDVTEAIRTPEVSEIVSIVARIPEVRDYLLNMQRELAMNNNIIMDGRDIGTVVLPNAQNKFFLTASLEERAKRRLEELKQKGYKLELNEVLEDIMNRDRLDTEREVAPLKPAPDAVIIDTSQLSIEQVVERLINLVENGGNHVL